MDFKRLKAESRQREINRLQGMRSGLIRKQVFCGGSGLTHFESKRLDVLTKKLERFRVKNLRKEQKRCD